MPLVLRAQALWNALIQQSGEELFQSCGVLNLGPQHSDFIRNAQQSAQTFRLNAQTLSAEQIAQRWPEFRAPQGYVGVFEPDAGFLRAELAIATLIKLAKKPAAASCSTARSARWSLSRAALRSSPAKGVSRREKR